MRRECIQAVSKALGREITVTDADRIEQRIINSKRNLARLDPDRWQSLTEAQRLTEAAARAAQELVHEAALKKQRMQQTIAAHDKIENYTASQMASKADDTKLGALRRLISGKTDAKNNSTSAEVEAKGIVAGAMGKLADAWDTISPRMFGLLANKEAEEQFVRAAYGQTRGIRPEIVKAAKAWREVTDRLRERFNAAGGDVGKLDNWGMPQSWAQDIAIKRGKDAFVKEMMNLVDRTVYRHDDGRAFSNAEMADFLGHAWTTIATNAANKPVRSGHPGGSIKANRHSQERQLHFRTPEAALAAMRKWGGRSVAETMASHINRMARDIALIEQFGPNADYAVSHFIEKYKAEAALTQVGREGFDPGEIDKQATRIANLYNYVAGNHPPPPSHRMASAMGGLRSIMSAAKLGSASITSLADEGTLHLTARVNNLPAFKLFMQELRTLNPLDRSELRMAKRAGLIVNTMLDDVNRFGEETLGSHIPHKIASAVIRASGLNALTEARRRAFSVTMMDTIGALTRKVSDVAGLDPHDWKILRGKGIDQATWDIWRKAKPDDWEGGHSVLTPESIYGISDADMEHAIAPAIAKLKEDASRSIAELDARNQQETGWIQSRANGFNALIERTAEKVRKFAASKESGARETANRLSLRAELLKAQVEHAQVRADIDAYLLANKQQEQVRRFLDDVQEGKGADVIAEKTDRSIQSYSRKRGSIGEKLGKREGSILRRITEIEANIRAAHRDAGAAVRDKADAEAARIEAASSELESFISRSLDRQQRRAAVMERLHKDIDPRIKQEISIAREKAATKLLAVVMDERDIAVVEPGAAERAAMYGETVRGTVTGELLRSIMQFKSFPFAMLNRHWGRALGMYENTSGKVGYISALLAAQTVMGAVALEINDIVSGRDPRSLNPANPYGAGNILSAVLKGGGLSLYGDLLFADANEYGRTLAGALGGPMLGLTEDAWKLTIGNAREAAFGEETNFGAEAARFARGYTPGASLWYTKAATDRLIFHQLQELANPGYLRRAQQRARKTYGTNFWWDQGALPGEIERGPDLENITKE